MKFLNISLIKYINSPNEVKDEYELALKYSDYSNRPVDNIGIGRLDSKTFGVVKDLQQQAKQGFCLKEYIDTFVQLSGKSIKEIVSIPVFDFFATKTYLDTEIIRINETEEKLLSHDSTFEEQAAGLDRFAKFGVSLQIDSLAGGDVTKWEAVRALPYEVAFLKLLMDKTKADFSKDYNDIMSKRRKH